MVFRWDAQHPTGYYIDRAEIGPMQRQAVCYLVGVSVTTGVPTPFSPP
jgi:hypothetical protein